MRRVTVEINPSEIIIYEGNKENQVRWIVDEKIYPQLRDYYSEGIYKAFIDKMYDPFRIKFMKKIN